MQKPGIWPFTRGIYANMYQGRPWTMRMFAGFGSAEDTNKRFKLLLENGQTGLSTAFDIPTLMGWDSDSRRSKYLVGLGGVAVDSIEDFRILYGGIPQDQVSTSMTINGPAIIFCSMYKELALECGYRLKDLRGTIQADPLKEFHAQNEYIVAPEPSMKLLVDMIEYCTTHMPLWHPVSISGYHIREKAGQGATELELGLMLANGKAIVKACLERGLDIDKFGPRLSFFLDFANPWLLEIAKHRAARTVWAKITKEFGAKTDRAMQLRTHTQTAGMSLTREQELINIVRVTIHAMGAVLGGTQSLHTNSYDEQISLPSEEAAKIALRIQQIIALETDIPAHPDPLGGSYVIEKMTRELEKSAWKYIKKIDELGGMLQAICENVPRADIVRASVADRRALENGERHIVGQTIFKDEEVVETIFTVDEDMQLEIIERCRENKSNRDHNSVNGALERIYADAKDGKNVFRAISRAVRVSASVGEITMVLKRAYGKYRAPVLS